MYKHDQKGKGFIPQNTILNCEIVGLKGVVSLDLADSSL